MKSNFKSKFRIVLTNRTMAIEGSPTFEDLVQVTMSAVVSQAKHIIKQKPEARAVIFDSMNVMFSNVLHEIDPSADIHPELDPLSILEAENAAMDEAIAKGDTEAFKKVIEK